MKATRFLRGLTISLLALSVVLFAIAPWIEGPDSARLGGTASVLLLAGVFAGAAWAIRAGAKL